MARWPAETMKTGNGKLNEALWHANEEQPQILRRDAPQDDSAERWAEEFSGRSFLATPLGDRPQGDAVFLRSFRELYESHFVFRAACSSIMRW